MVAVAFIGGTLFLLQQFAGINGVLYFSSLTFQNVGITSGAQASLYVGVTNFAGAQIVKSHLYQLYIWIRLSFLMFPWLGLIVIGALCSSYLIDKQGRKKLLIGSYLGMVNISCLSHKLFTFSLL